jgi:hypothetical protein
MSSLTILRAGLLAGILAFIAACGAATPATPAVGAPTPAEPGQQTPGQPGQPSPEQPGQPTAEQPGQATPDQPPPAAGGWDVQDPCGLIPVEEMSAALGMDIQTAEENIGGDTTYCSYTADGRPIVATSFSRQAVNRSIYATWATQEDAVVVPGIADGAAWAQGVLYILSGDALLAIQPSQVAMADLTPEQALAALTQLARTVADRL